MSTLFAFVKKLARVLSFPEKPKGYCTVSTAAPLPSPVLGTINSIRSGKGWVWKGEYYAVPDAHPALKEILMYTAAGKLRVVRILESGELVSVAPRKKCRFTCTRPNNCLITTCICSEMP
jgi:hypothetical protein